MKTLFANARLIDPEAGTDEIGSLLIEDGKISDCFARETPRISGEVIDCGSACLAPGLIDIGVKVSEPGERHKESFRSAGEAAAAGGVTTIVTRPDTLAPIDTPESLEYVTRRAAEAAPVHVRPMAALTKERLGREMVEIGFLKDAGAVAFSDGDNVVESPKVLARCMTYAKDVGAIIIGHPQDPTLSDGAVVTSGSFASLRGLPAVSPLAERMGLDRDLTLAEMTGVSYHGDQITTRVALERLALAKTRGLNVTAGISVHHLTLNALDIADYRTFFKVKPPLRDEDDRVAAVEAVASGLIDIISSMHTPQDEESKRLPFEEAASGAVGLETLLPAALRLYHSGDLGLSDLFRAVALNPAKRLGLACGRLGRGAPADLVLFDPDKPFVLDRWSLLSKSKNTPFDGQRLQGRVLATYVLGKRVYGAN